MSRVKILAARLLRRFGAFPTIAVAACVVVGSLALVFGARTSTHDADTALFAIMAKEKITWYYWDQNRFGSLIPFLTAWIRAVPINMAAQLFLGSVAGFASIAFVMELTGVRTWRLEGFFVAIILLMTCMKPQFVGAYFVGPVPYPVSCALFYAGLRMARSQIRMAIMLPLAALLFWLAFFVDFALCVIVVPILGVDCLRSWRSRAPWLTLGLALLGALVAFVQSTLPATRTPSAIVGGEDPLGAALGAMLGMFNVTHFAVAAGLVAICWFAARRCIPTRLSVPSAALIIPGILLASAGLYASTLWVQLNGNQPRYYLIQDFTIATMAACWMAGVTIGSLHQVAPRLLAVLRYGLPAVALASTVWLAGGVRPIRFVSTVPGRELAVNTDMKAIARRTPVDHPVVVAGDYWLTMPIVYALLSRRDAPRVFALAPNWQTMRPELRKVLASGQAVTLLCVQLPLGYCGDILANWGGLRPGERRQIVVGEDSLASGGEYIIAESQRK